MNVGRKIMDVDAPNILKRCSSAPLINEGASTAATSPSTSATPRSTSFFGMFTNSSQPRTRSNSMSCSPSNLLAPIVANTCNRRLTPRVNQLRAEECEAVSNTREVAHEREVHTAMQMGQSCEDLTLVANSPTRIPRFSPVVSPSPTRKFTTRRSLSPIPLRASNFSPVSRPTALAGKRRGDEADSPQPKRPCTGRVTPGTPGTPDSDSLDCTFRPVAMNEGLDENHKASSPS
ncbi:uncharacterized protein [Epargyreus clarus]|uniref:uncharacterized protein n=1 Tax=Epargyreus clarus TaxID=520877 RepID=UPI003C2EDCDD